VVCPLRIEFEIEFARLIYVGLEARFHKNKKESLCP
jgi:hypothetical protein